MKPAGCGQNRIQLVQWREYGDDDDSLEVKVYAAGDETDYVDDIREDYSIEEPDEVDEEGSIFVIADITIQNGEILETNGRKFRIVIEEVN